MVGMGSKDSYVVPH
ncbi:unnamed protein product [Oikopleura dioica]|uniref:Uncharacterized protein n=1 Tax=Oikopleura dioica TaxID=34765 RepID=E4XIH8_OIKDI|nr:unnamed protein product [Oikopleura dioica]